MGKKRSVIETGPDFGHLLIHDFDHIADIFFTLDRIEIVIRFSMVDAIAPTRRVDASSPYFFSV